MKTSRFNEDERKARTRYWQASIRTPKITLLHGEFAKNGASQAVMQSN